LVDAARAPQSLEDAQGAASRVLSARRRAGRSARARRPERAAVSTARKPTKGFRRDRHPSTQTPEPVSAAFLVPLALLAALGFALGWPPSQRAHRERSAQARLKAGAVVASVAMRPFTSRRQQQSIADRNHQIRELTARL